MYEIRLTYEYKSIVHECIHRIQNNFGLNSRNKYWGLIEGVMILAGSINTDANGMPLGD